MAIDSASSRGIDQRAHPGRGSDDLPLVNAFVSAEDDRLTREFLADGYIIRDVADRDALDEMRDRLAAIVAKELDVPAPNNAEEFLDAVHERVTVERLNGLRLATYRAINAQDWFRPTYFHLGRPYVERLVGNELAMQNRINLSIQLPHDRTSLLDIHADVFSGETPYQVVQWLPLVNVFRTKSMFILPRTRSIEVTANFKDYERAGMAGLFERLKDEVRWLDIPYGKVLVFTPNCLHGNIVNAEPTTRWTFNARFAPLLAPTFSPEKALGSFYLPITPKATTRIGMSYRHPTGFEE
jgi:sporadic carbohydrate cluster 2OG-Fe(II) oxygenase